MSVQVPFFVLTKYPYVIVPVYRAFHALDADGGVHVWGKAAVYPIHLAQKYPDADNTLR